MLNNIKNIKITYDCPVCGITINQKFIESNIYSKIKDNHDMIIDYIEGHLSYDDIEKLEDNEEVLMRLYPSLCGNKDCKRIQLKNNKEEQLKLIKVPPLFLDIPPIDDMDSEFDGKLGVLYTGKVGAGKSCKAIALLKRFILNKGGVTRCTYKFINVCDLFFKMQEEIKKNIKESKSIVKTCIDVDILVLDDLGIEKYSEWTETQMYLIVNSRLENMKHTIITANISKDDKYEDSFNARLASRLHLYNAKNVHGNDKRKEGK